MNEAGDNDLNAGSVQWFSWRDVRAAIAFGRTGGIALHRFRHDLRAFGLGQNEPACHMLSADRAALVQFASQFGLKPEWIEPPRSRRPDIWHFDLFGVALRKLEVQYPPPSSIDSRGEAVTEHLLRKQAN